MRTKTTGLANDIFISLSSGLKFKNPQRNNARQPPRKRQRKHLKNSPKVSGSLPLEEVAAFRKRLRIHVSGSAVPDPISTFDLDALIKSINAQNPSPNPNELQVVAKTLLANIESSKYVEPTPVQMQSLPCMCASRDLLACAPTGSGKTAAFLIPLLLHLRNSPKGLDHVRAVIVAPTRELAGQILREAERLAKGRRLKIRLLRKAASESAKQAACDIMISTPQRLVRAVREKLVDVSRAKWLVLDEVDKLFEMGFVEQVDEILSACGSATPSIQRALFSATMLPKVEALARSILRDPIQLTIGTKNAAAETVDQQLIFVGQEEGKLVAIQRILQEGKLTPPALLFVQSKDRAKELYQELIYDGIKVDCIHADRTQMQRDEVIKRFRSGKIWVLICTDLMARGVDFKAVNCVINYDLPTSAISYIHRVGRTGRAGREGTAITFYTLKDLDYLRAIANVMNLSGAKLEDWLLKLKKPDLRQKHKLEKRPTKRAKIATTSDYDVRRGKHKRNLIRQSKAKKHRTGKQSSNPGKPASNDRKTTKA